MILPQRSDAARMPKTGNVSLSLLNWLYKVQVEELHHVSALFLRQQSNNFLLYPGDLLYTTVEHDLMNLKTIMFLPACCQMLFSDCCVPQPE